MNSMIATVAMVCMLNSPATSLPNHPESEALEIIDRYMAILHSDLDELNNWRPERLAVLHELKSIPEEAALAISFVLPRASSVTHRVELVELLGRLPVTTSTGLFISLLSDPEPKVRYWAVHGLRGQSSRIVRSGLRNVPVIPWRDPAVKGLVPFLAAAVGDDDKGVRGAALVALADTREDEAMAFLRQCLDHQDQSVRLDAAYYLSEINDKTGLPVLVEALRRLLADPSDRDRIGFYFDTEKIVLALERLTGESLGEIPMNPHLYSSSEAGKSAAETYENLLAAWGDYFATTSFRE